MAAIQCSATLASFLRHGANGKHTESQTHSTRSSSSFHSGQLRLGSIMRTCITRNPAITLLKRRTAEAVNSNGISACLGAPPAAGSAGGSRSNDLITSLAVAIAIPAVSGALVSLFYGANADWYKGLKKPQWNPPDWLFGAVWGLLYGTMGFASWLVWARGGWEAQGYALTLYALQLLLNLVWPALFFGAKSVVAALVDLVALWVCLVACVQAFHAVNPLAARLLYPYIAWVTFACVLNYSYWMLNTS